MVEVLSRILFSFEMFSFFRWLRCGVWYIYMSVNNHYKQ